MAGNKNIKIQADFVDTVKNLLIRIKMNIFASPIYLFSGDESK